MFENDNKVLSVFSTITKAIVWIFVIAGCLISINSMSLDLIYDEEASISPFAYLLTLMPFTWVVWFLICHNKKQKPLNLFAIIPLVVCTIFWIVAIVPIFDEEPGTLKIIGIVLYLLLFLGGGIWEMLKGKVANAKTKSIVSWVFFGAILLVHNDLSGILLLDLEIMGTSVFFTYLFYAVLFYMAATALLIIAKHVVGINEKLHEENKNITVEESTPLDEKATEFNSINDSLD